jgi:hypothetical protein
LSTLWVYLGGVLSGSLAASVTNDGFWMVGASSGIYSLLMSHIPHVWMVRRNFIIFMKYFNFFKFSSELFNNSSPTPPDNLHHRPYAQRHNSFPHPLPYQQQPRAKDSHHSTHRGRFLWNFTRLYFLPKSK